MAQCPPGKFGDNSTWRCVTKCPSNPALYGDFETRICVINCPEGYYGDDYSRTCVKKCPSNPRYYAYEPTKRCLEKCLYPYFGEAAIGRCVTTCYWGEYKNMTTHNCDTCHPTCTSCVSYLGCETCILNYYLYNGTCLSGGCESGVCGSSSCPINYATGMITYASPVSLLCVETCPSVYYGLNSTRYCVKNCPINYYPSSESRRCEPCINGCNNCTNTTYCSSCYEGYLFIANENTCIKQCSTTMPYFYGSTCLKACINGTYLLSDEVTCGTCASICATCSKTATNCTKCVGAFLYNSNCVTKCPTNFYADTNLICQRCTSTTKQCTV